MATVIDSYSETNQDSVFTFGAVGGGSFGTTTEIGQCFTGNGAKIVDARFYARKRSSPTGNAVARIWTMTGTFGVNGTTGTLLATSDNFNVSTLGASFTLTTFTFTGAQQFQTVNGTNYVVTVQYLGGSSTNTVDLGYDGSSGTHPGTWTYYDGTWHPTDAGIDFVFYVDGVSDVSVNLSGVSASPAVGDGSVTIGSVVVTPPVEQLVAGGRRHWPWAEDEVVYLDGVAASPRIGSGNVTPGQREIPAGLYFPRRQPEPTDSSGVVGDLAKIKLTAKWKPPQEQVQHPPVIVVKKPAVFVNLTGVEVARVEKVIERYEEEMLAFLDSL